MKNTMEPDRWRQIEELCHAALEREEGQRTAFLAEACAGDESLRREVESLLAHENTARDFMEAPAMEVAAKAEGKNRSGSRSSNPASSFAAGKTVSHYRIGERLGGGGMGVVYKAEDIRLRRAVALKFLPEDLEQDHQAFERLRREAQSASALNHPNICTVYDIDEFEGRPFIAMELLEGRTLKRRIAGKPLKTDEIIELAIQVTEALEAAHLKGIIHRDIKPENIFILSTSGAARLKVLDFGIAKQLPARLPAEPGDSSTALATEETEVPVTLAGLVLGTVSYMSPEQARGEKLDSRTDLFSFGAVLYEMATGKQSFPGSTSAVVFDAILNREPAEASTLNPNIPPKLDEIIHKGLEKDPKLRYQNASDFRTDLMRLRRDTESGRIPAVSERGILPSARHRAFRLVSRRFAAATAAVIAFVAVLAFLLRSPLPPPKILQYAQLTSDGLAKSDPLVSDGVRLYFTEQISKGSIIAQVPVTGGDIVPLNLPLTNPQLWDISPDKAELLVSSPYGPGAGPLGKGDPIWAVSVTGASPRRLGDLVGRAAKWSADGQNLAYFAGTDLYVAKSDGSEPHKLVSAPAGAWGLRWSPDGARLRFTGFAKDRNTSTIWEVSADGTNLHDFLPGWARPPAIAGWGAWTPDGRYYLFRLERTGPNGFWAYREHASLFRSADHGPYQLGTGAALNPNPSPDGKTIYARASQDSDAIVRCDLKSGNFVPYLPGVHASAFDISRNGEWITYTTYDLLLFRSRLDGSERLQLTSAPMGAMEPRWSPDGRQIAFVGWTGASKPMEIYLVSGDRGAPQELTATPNQADLPDWAPDGNSLVFVANPQPPNAPASLASIATIDLRTRQVSKLAGSEGLGSPRWSPNGRHIVALSAKGQELRLFDSSTRKWTTLLEDRSAEFNYPVWSKDGKTIYFLNLGSKERAIFKVGINGMPPEKVASLSELWKPLDSVGWMALSPDGSPALCAVGSSEEIFAYTWEAP